MKKYYFLFKPAFFIFKLVFSCWLVLQIEEISPSDFGKYESLFKSVPNTLQKGSYDQLLRYDHVHLSSLKQRQAFLKKVCEDYKEGLIDSTMLNRQLEKLLKAGNRFHGNNPEGVRK